MRLADRAVSIVSARYNYIDWFSPYYEPNLYGITGRAPTEAQNQNPAFCHPIVY